MCEPLPNNPSKGLAAFTERDAPLFAGRGAHITECLERLQDVGVGLLMLHGPTATGKSSFLRAGLVPHLRRLVEEAGPDALMLRQRYPVYVRSTIRPLAAISSALLKFADQQLDPVVSKYTKASTRLSELNLQLARRVW